MNHDHDGFDALCAQLRNQGIHCGGFVAKFQTGYARGRDDGGRSPQRHADECDFHAVEFLDAVSRQQGAAGGGRHHVGRQPLELGAFVWHGGAHRCTFTTVGVLHTAHHAAAAVLQAQQLGRAPIKFVVSHRVELKADAIQGFDGGFVIEQRRDQWCGTNKVTRAHHHVVGILLFQLGDVCGQKVRAAHGWAVSSGHAKVVAESASGFELTVVVVETKYPDFDVCCNRP